MTQRSFDQTHYKLIPFHPVPFFLAIAGSAILVNLLVLLGILLQSLKLNLAERFKHFIRPEKKKQKEEAGFPTHRFADGAYEMDVGVGSSSETANPPQRTTPVRNTAEKNLECLGQIWGPGGAAMRDSMT